MRVTCGIPQGSCLGPLLFILYLNDFENCLQYSSASMYADDTHTTISARDIEELVRKTQVELGWKYFRMDEDKEDERKP